MHVHQFIRKPPIIATPDTPVRDVAKIMRDSGFGALPIVSQGRPVGIVTDRDIVTRLLPALVVLRDIPASRVMSPNPVTCSGDRDIEEAAVLMADAQVRRLLVLSPGDDLLGLLSIDDIAENVSERLAGETLGEIVEVR